MSQNDHSSTLNVDLSLLSLSELMAHLEELVSEKGGDNIMRNGATEDDIRKAEERLGVTLPDDFRDFLRITNGTGLIDLDDRIEFPELFGAEHLKWDRQARHGGLNLIVEREMLELPDERRLQIKKFDRDGIIELSADNEYNVWLISPEKVQAAKDSIGFTAGVDGGWRLITWQHWSGREVWPYPSFRAYIEQICRHVVRKIGEPTTEDELESKRPPAPQEDPWTLADLSWSEEDIQPLAAPSPPSNLSWAELLAEMDELSMQHGGLRVSMAERASEESIQAAEARLGVTLPGDFKAFLAVSNGLANADLHMFATTPLKTIETLAWETPHEAALERPLIVAPAMVEPSYDLCGRHLFMKADGEGMLQLSARSGTDVWLITPAKVQAAKDQVAFPSSTPSDWIIIRWRSTSGFNMEPLPSFRSYIDDLYNRLKHYSPSLDPDFEKYWEERKSAEDSEAPFHGQDFRLHSPAVVSRLSWPALLEHIHRLAKGKTTLEGHDMEESTVTPQSIQVMESQLGVSLPDDYKDFCAASGFFGAIGTKNAHFPALHGGTDVMCIKWGRCGVARGRFTMVVEPEMKDLPNELLQKLPKLDDDGMLQVTPGHSQWLWLVTPDKVQAVKDSIGYVGGGSAGWRVLEWSRWNGASGANVFRSFRAYMEHVCLKLQKEPFLKRKRSETSSWSSESDSDS